jgi:hypothetical protein
MMRAKNLYFAGAAFASLQAGKGRAAFLMPSPEVQSIGAMPASLMSFAQ